MVRIALRSLVAVALLWLAGSYLARVLPGARTSVRVADMAGRGGTSASKTLSAQVLTVDADLLGHFMLHPIVENQRTTMLVDTGASLVALTNEDALAVGIRPAHSDFTLWTATANGIVGVAPVRIREMRVGDIVVRNVDAVVMPPGVLGQSLLGMSFLRRLSGFEISHGQLTLRG